MDILHIILRVLHVGSAIALLGGTLFTVAVMLPSLRLLDDGLRASVLQVARKRFYRIAHPALLLLLLTGFYSFYENIEAYRKASPAIHGLLGVKILLAMAVIVIVFAQTFGLLKGCPKRWAMVNLVMGVAIVILAAVVRSLRMGAAG